MRARLRLELKDRDGALLAVREEGNAVLRGGATMIAGLFAGSGTGITHMAVGTSDAPEGEAFATTQLENMTEAPLAPESFQVDPPDPVKNIVRVRVRGTIPAEGAVGTVREAALLSRGEGGATLYNRVIFAPIEKGDDHELTLFWEVAFPFGDLQWLL